MPRIIEMQKVFWFDGPKIGVLIEKKKKFAFLIHFTIQVQHIFAFLLILKMDCKPVQLEFPTPTSHVPPCLLESYTPVTLITMMEV